VLLPSSRDDDLFILPMDPLVGAAGFELAVGPAHQFGKPA
jgi:hypothetical protein